MANNPKKKKALGGKQPGAMGTGKVIPKKDANNWTQSIAEKQSAIGGKAVNTKMVPISHVVIDPDNPRELSVEPNEIQSIAECFPIDKDAVQNDHAGGNWIESYISSLKSQSGFTGKKLDDLESIARFACALKGAERLINPVIAWQNESTFQLIAGERRYLAHLLLAEPLILLRILASQPTKLELKRIQWDENNLSEELSLIEKLRNQEAIMSAWQEENPTGVFSINTLSTLSGMGRSTAQRYLAVIRCDNPELMAAIEKGSLANLNKAAELAALERDDLLAELGQKVKKETTFKAKLPPTRSAKPLSYIINTLADSIANDDLSRTINELDLTHPSKINEALALIIKHLEKTCA